MVLAARSSAVRKLVDGHTLRHAPSTDTVETLKPDGSWLPIDGPFNLCIELTTACNMSCHNCFASSSAERQGTFRDANDVFRDIETAAHSVIRVCVTGGEPLLHPEIDRIVGLPSMHRNLAFALSSNFSARPDVDEELASQGWFVWASLHGHRDAHNEYTQSCSFECVTERIRRYSRIGVIRISTVLHDRMSEQDVEWLLRFREECGIPMLRFVVPRQAGRFRPLTSRRLVDAVSSRLDNQAELRFAGTGSRLIDVRGNHRLTE